MKTEDKDTPQEAWAWSDQNLEEKQKDSFWFFAIIFA